MPIDHFRALAGVYDRLGDYFPTEEFIRALNPQPGCHILDAGGGTGRVSNAFRTMVAKTTVADPSLDMLGYAHQKGLGAICAPAEHLPFAPESFERVIMVDAFHHVEDQGQTAKELWRVLAPAGRLLIIEPDLHTFLTKLLAVGEKLLLMRSHFLTYENISLLFGQVPANLEVVRVNNTVIIIIEKR